MYRKKERKTWSRHIVQSYNQDMIVGSRLLSKENEEVCGLVLFATKYTPSGDKFFYIMQDH